MAIMKPVVSTFHLKHVEDWTDSDQWESQIFQLSTGTLDIHLEFVELVGVRFQWTSVGARCLHRDVYLGSQILFGIIFESPSPVLYRGRDWEFDEIRVWQAGPDQPHEYIVPVGMQGVMIGVDLALTELLGWRMPSAVEKARSWRDLSSLLSVCRQATHAARRVPRSELIEWRDRVLSALEVTLAPPLTSEIGPSLSALADTKAYKFARRIEDEFLFSRQPNAPSPDDMAAELGISRRSLFNAFRNWPGLGPIHYLRLIRLNQLRSDLVAGNPDTHTVAQLAHQHGFTHLGRLSAYYHEQFGEYPSETLRKGTTLGS